MLVAHAKILIHAPAETVYDFLMDVERFPGYDEKAAKLEYIDRSKDLVRISGIFGLIPYSADFKLTRHPGKGYQSELVQGPLAYARGQFWLHPEGEYTALTHIEEFRFHPPFDWVMERVMAPYVQATVEREVQAVKRMVEGRSVAKA